MPLPYKLKTFEMGVQFLAMKVHVFSRIYICLPQLTFENKLLFTPQKSVLVTECHSKVKVM
jgi:hypothetical protein